MATFDQEHQQVGTQFNADVMHFGAMQPRAFQERLFVTVPPPGPALIGRADDIARIRARLVVGGRVGVSAINGLPGIGKTALALALAYDEATLRHFTGGVLWAALGPRADVDSVLGSWGTDVQLDVSSRRTTKERLDHLIAHLKPMLADRPFLMILDDAWSWDDVSPFRRLASPGSAQLLTTRDEALARRFGRAPPITLHELQEDVATELLARACPEALVADPVALGELVRAVGGLPLALVLMGGELAAHAGQPRWVRHTIARLRAREEQLALTEDEARPGLPNVSLSLRAIIELSLAALPDAAARTAFYQLAVFAPKPADFSVEAACAVWEAPEEVGDAWLQSLCRCGLVEVAGEDRFTLHQVVAAVASSRLAERSDVHRRHLIYYRQIIDRDREAWARIEPELAQIRQAWAWVSDAPGEDAEVLAFVRSMQTFMGRRGLWTEQLAWCERALESARTLRRPSQEADLLTMMGDVHRRMAMPKAALACLEQAQVIWRKYHLFAGAAAALGSIGELHHGLGHLDSALESYQQALEFHRRLGDRAGEAAILNVIGGVQYDRGDYDGAMDLYEQALAIRRQVGDRAGEAASLNNIGQVHRKLGDLESSLRILARALDIRREVGDRVGESTTLYNIGIVHVARGDLVAAVSALEHAVALEREIGHPDLEADRRYLEALRARMTASSH